MLEMIIEQDSDIVNYVMNLNLPYSNAIRNHMINMISGIILTESNKTLSSMYSKITCNRHTCNASRFLSQYTWNDEFVNDQRIYEATSHIKKSVKEDAVGFLIIDDTLSKKDKSTKKIEGLDFHNSHADGNRPMWSHCVVTSHYRIGEYSIPMGYKLYQREQAFGKDAYRYFKNKQELAMDLIDEFAPATVTNYLLIDSWYTSGKVILHALKRGYHTIGMIKSNRVIYPAGIKISVSKFAKYVSKSETRPVTVGKDTYYVYRYEGKINDIENAVVLISWSKKDLSDKPVYILSTDITLDNRTIIKYYQNRWDIEVSYRYCKTTLGFDEYQIHSIKSIKRYWSMVYSTYTFLELYRVSNMKKVQFETLGDVIGHFRDRYLVQIVKYAYICAENKVNIGTIIANLGLCA